MNKEKNKWDDLVKYISDQFGDGEILDLQAILFLIGVVFFLTNYFDIFKFITAFTIAHCITLVFATFFGRNHPKNKVFF